MPSGGLGGNSLSGQEQGTAGHGDQSLPQSFPHIDGAIGGKQVKGDEGLSAKSLPHMAVFCGLFRHRESWRAYVRRISGPPIFLVLLPLAADKLSDEALDAVAGVM
jgi:hypothetical protein